MQIRITETESTLRAFLRPSGHIIELGFVREQWRAFCVNVNQKGQSAKFVDFICEHCRMIDSIH